MEDPRTISDIKRKQVWNRTYSQPKSSMHTSSDPALEALPTVSGKRQASALRPWSTESAVGRGAGSLISIRRLLAQTRT